MVLAMTTLTPATYAKTNDGKKPAKVAKHTKKARHIILWTLKSDLTPEKKQELIADLKAIMPELKKKIPGVIKLDVVSEGRMASSNCDFMFDFIFESAEALNNFNTHPEHLKAASKLKPYIQGRTCLDIEFTK